MPRSSPFLLMDANVLIDFCDTDRSIIKLISEHVGRVHVPLPILVEEVDQIVGPADWDELGLSVVEPPIKTAVLAATRRAGLSFHDHLCLLLARDNGWTCVTNDGRLRRECRAEGVELLWGLEVIARVVEAGALERSAAAAIGRAIRAANPYFITAVVLERFLQRISVTSRTRR